MLEKIRTYMLPLAMAVGFVFSDFFAQFGYITPYVLFTMLFVTFCRINIKDLQIKPQHCWLLGIQIFGSILVYMLVRTSFDEVVAQGILISIMAPTAISAIVIATILGANMSSMATFTLFSNMSIAVVAPIVFSLVGNNAEMPFIDSFLLIIGRVMPLLLLPFILATILHKIWLKLHTAIAKFQILSFYLWAIALVIVTAQTIKSIADSPKDNYTQEIMITALAFVACIGQFALGRWLGGRYGDSIAGAQSLGQKNTILAIWMAQTYLNPIASIGPASYVLWQNLMNSYQLWRKG